MKDDKMLRAVFSNIPISFLTELKKYRTKNSFVRVQYRGRSGRRDAGGSVSLKNAKRFTLYIHGRESDSNYISRDEHCKITNTQSNRINELVQILKEKMNSIQSIHDGYFRQLKDKNEFISNLESSINTRDMKLFDLQNKYDELQKQHNNLKHVSDCADTVLDERFKAIVKLEKDNHALQVALTKEENTRHELISEKNDEITELLKTIRTLSKYLDY